MPMKFFTELSLQQGIIPCFLGSLLMFKCCFALYSELLSCLNYFSLLPVENLALTHGPKTEAMCQIPVATRAISNSHYHCWHERIRCRTEGISNTEVSLQCSQQGSLSDLIAPTDSNLLASCPKLPVTSVMPCSSQDQHGTKKVISFSVSFTKGCSVQHRLFHPSLGCKQQHMQHGEVGLDSCTHCFCLISQLTYASSCLNLIQIFGTISYSSGVLLIARHLSSSIAPC